MHSSGEAAGPIRPARAPRVGAAGRRRRQRGVKQRQRRAVVQAAALQEPRRRVVAALRERMEAYIAQRERETGLPNPMSVARDWPGSEGRGPDLSLLEPHTGAGALSGALSGPLYSSSPDPGPRAPKLVPEDQDAGPPGDRALRRPPGEAPARRLHDPQLKASDGMNALHFAVVGDQPR